MRNTVLAILFIAGSASAQTPRMDSITPSQGPIAGGTIVTITGANFNGATIMLDRAPIAPQSRSDLAITLQMPPHDNGYTLIQIGGAAAEFLYVPPTLEDLPPGFITTVAGIGNYVRTFGPANKAVVIPDGVVFDAAGNLYIAEAPQHRVTRVGPEGDIHSFAGGNFFMGNEVLENVPAIDGGVAYPFGVAVGPGGKIYIGSHGAVLRVVDPQSGIISNAAGNNTIGFSGDGGLAHDALIGQATWVAADSSNVYFIDWDNTRVRRIDANGIISTYAGNGAVGYSGDGGPATNASLNFGVADFGALALDARGDLFIADSQNGAIRRVNKSTGVITTFYGAAGDTRSLAVDGDDNVYYGTGGKIVKLNSKGVVVASWGAGAYGLTDDGPITPSLRLGHIVGLAIDANGNIVFADDSFPRVRRLNLQTNRIETIAGTYPAYQNENGPALAAPLMNDYVDIAFDRAGNLLIGDGRLRRVDKSGNVQTIAGATPSPNADNVPAQLMSNGCVAIDVNRDGGIDVAEPGNIGHIDSASIYHLLGPLDGGCAYDGDGGPFRKAHLCQPWDTARDSSGNLYIADTNNNRLRRVDGRTGIITTFAGNGGPVNGLERYGQGVTCGDGGPAIDACLNTPFNLTIDPDDNLYVSGAGSGAEVRKIGRDGIITRFASLVNTQKMSFNRGFLYTSQIAGVLRIDPSGAVTRLAGIGSGSGIDSGFSGDGGPALAARISGGAPAVNPDGDLFFFDGSRRIRAVRYGAVLAPQNATIQAAASGSTIRATVFDAAGHPAPSVRVDFTAPASGPSCHFPNNASTIGVVTDQTGVATTSCVPNCLGSGSFVVTAQPLTATATASVTMSDIAGPCRRRAARH